MRSVPQTDATFYQESLKVLSLEGRSAEQSH
jgi:hypothetical protein